MPSRAQRVWLEYTQRHIEPDVEIVTVGSKAPKARGGDLALVTEPQEGGPWS